MTLTLSSSPEKRQTDEHALIAGKRRRRFRDALTGYLFVLPALLATLLFGLWPVISGFYESLKSGSPITNRYVGLDNYVRSLGSLTYVLLFGLSLILLYMGYRVWRALWLDQRLSGATLWHYLIPGLLGGLGLIILVFNFVTGSRAYDYLPLTLSLLAIAGYFIAESLQRPSTPESRRELAESLALIALGGLVWIAGRRLELDGALSLARWAAILAVAGYALARVLPRMGRFAHLHYASATLMIGLFMLLAILLALFTASEMEGDVEQAQAIAARIFNQQVLNARVEVPADGAVIAGLEPPDDLMVQVEVGGETIEAPLAPEAYASLSPDRIGGLVAAFVNNQKVQVVLPDGTTAEGVITGLPIGESLRVEIPAEDARILRQTEIYNAMLVGESVIRVNGRTEPLNRQLLAALGIFVGIAAIYTINHVRRQLEEEEQPREYRWLGLGRIALGVAIAVLFFYLLGSVQLSRQAANAMRALSQDQFKLAYTYVYDAAPPAILRPEALAARLLYWPQVFLIASGALLIGVAYQVWQSAQKRETKLGFGLTIMLAVLLMVGGWLTISELPRTIALGGREADDTFDALVRTAMYSVGTVPIQLALGLFLAYLLFSEVDWGKSLFRVIYFMPYIAPSVATATVFIVIFKLDDTSLANQVLRFFGLEPVTWLKEPAGIFRLMYKNILGGDPLNIPSALQGPSLALTTVILYNIWVFAGYNAVIFLAGLGAIPGELYEAAEVDGAGRWSRFRNITLPLLSPTTFFLSMLSIIGTFKAFTHIYVLRDQAAGKEIDTMSVHIFQQLYAANDPGYAAALAFVLFAVILVLTLVQNRLAREQVFYG